MARFYMLAGGIVDPGGGHSGAVSAYVALAAGRSSRLFKVEGPTAQPTVSELPAATTVDLGRFEAQLREDLQPALDEVTDASGVASIAKPSSDWVCGILRKYLEETEGFET